MINTNDSMSLFAILQQGGVLMIPLAICSLLALAIIVERLIWGPRRSRTIPQKLLADIKDLLTRGKLEEILGLCRAENSPLARIVLAAVRNVGRNRRELVEVMEMAGKKEALRLQRYVGILGTIASISPLLGLLGTVFGMIRIFSVISSQGVGNAAAMAGGISEALITTATGLTIAIPAFVFYRYFLHLTKQLVAEMEEISIQVMDELISIHHSKFGGEELSPRREIA